MRQHKSPPSRPPRTCVRSSVPSASLRRPEPEPDDHGRRLLELPFAVRQTGAHVVPGRSWRSPARHLGRSSCSPPPRCRVRARRPWEPPLGALRGRRLQRRPPGLTSTSDSPSSACAPAGFVVSPERGAGLSAGPLCVHVGAHSNMPEMIISFMLSNKYFLSI
jgi:hypothetical protein